MRLFCFCLLFLIQVTTISGQEVINPKLLASPRSDSTFLRKQILPVSLISAGVILEALNVKEEIQNAIPRTNIRLDNYIQYAPVVILYSADMLNINRRNSAFNQTKYLIISEITSALIVQGLKKITHVTRPTGAPLSFPSGHTANAFTSATVLYKEFEDSNKPQAFSGYLFSTATGVLRVTNNRHWVPDVLVGAGIAILVTNVVYYFEPLKNWNLFSKKANFTVIPEFDPEYNNYSLRISILI